MIHASASRLNGGPGGKRADVLCSEACREEYLVVIDRQFLDAAKTSSQGDRRDT